MGSISVLEERLLTLNGGQDPLYLVGCESIIGFTLSLIIALMASSFPCPFDEVQCVNGHIDDIYQVLHQSQQHANLLPLCICFGLSYGAYKIFATVLIQISSATNRVVLEQCRIVAVWMFFLAYQGDGHEDFSFGKLTGFLLIVIGVLMFNKVIDFGIKFDQHTPEKGLMKE